MEWNGEKLSMASSQQRPQCARISDKLGAATHAEWNPSACWAVTFQEEFFFLFVAFGNSAFTKMIDPRLPPGHRLLLLQHQNRIKS